MKRDSRIVFLEKRAKHYKTVLESAGKPPSFWDCSLSNALVFSNYDLLARSISIVNLTPILSIWKTTRFYHCVFVAKIGDYFVAFNLLFDKTNDCYVAPKNAKVQASDRDIYMATAKAVMLLDNAHEKQSN